MKIIQIVSYNETKYLQIVEKIESIQLNITQLNITQEELEYMLIHLLTYTNNRQNSLKLIHYIQLLLNDYFNIHELYYSEYHSEINFKEQKEILNNFDKAMNIIYKDLKSNDLYIKVLSCMSLITYKTGIRIGKDIYFAKYNSIGLSTLQKKHLTFTNNNCKINI